MNAKDPGKSYAWQQLRLRFLGENPLCAMCAEDGRVEAATVVDHKTPHRNDPALFWAADNLQPLCKPCHDSRKQRMEKGGKGYSKEVGLDGFPVDRAHPFYKRS